MKANILFALIISCALKGCSKDEALIPVQHDPVPLPDTGYVCFYVSVEGNDANDGRTKETPWKTIHKVNSTTVRPGQSILFKSAEKFLGNLDLSNKSGTTSKPVIIGSYGASRAIIDAGAYGSGILARNTQNVVVKDLVVKGDGYKVNPANGVLFYTDSSGIMENIVVMNLEIFGFMGRGLFFNVPWPNETTNSGGQLPDPGSVNAGYDGVIIENIVAHDNGMAGIETNGYWENIPWASRYNHRNITVRKSRAYNNRGVSNYKDNHSGSGIFIACVENALVEYCEAFNNGEENGLHTAGPIGIWFAEVRNGIIQYSESYGNKSGLGRDGGGFDVDGGSQNCIVQYCYSHDNEGSGFSVFEWGSGNKMSNVTIRYNISENDGFKNNYGGIALWSTHNIDEIYIHNNTVYSKFMSDRNSSEVSAIKIFPDQFISNLKVFNNIFIADGINAKIIGGNIGSGIWMNNIYWTANGASSNGFSYGTFADPKLSAPGMGGYQHPFISLNDGYGLYVYAPEQRSPVINTGITLGISMPETDFNGHSIPYDGHYDIGAIEYNLSVSK